MSPWERVADLPLDVEGYALEGAGARRLERLHPVSTVIRLRGGGEEGVGEDVTYDARRPRRLQDAGPTLALAGRAHARVVLRAASAALDLFPARRRCATSRALYRRWAFESAALDLALRQAGRSLPRRSGASRGRCASWSRCGSASRATIEPRAPAARRATRRCASSSTRRTRWDDDAGRRARAPPARSTRSTSRATTTGTIVDSRADPTLYRRVAEGFPDAWIEDPDLDAGDRRGARAAPRPHHLGRPDPLGRRHRGAAVPAADGQRQAVALRQPARAVRRLRLLRRATASAPTAAASSSSARAAARSSTSPRCSTPTRRTTSPPAATTTPTRPTACPSSPLPPEPAATGFRWGEWAER